MRLRSLSVLFVSLNLILVQPVSICQSIEAEFNNWKAKHNISDQSIAVSLVDLNAGEEQFAFRANKPMTPASTQKLISTFFALENFPEKKTFNTWVGHDAEIKDSILTGNLLVMGFGDMTLGSRYFDTDFMGDWLEELKKKGIRQIKGAVVCFSAWTLDQIIPSTWSDDDIGNYYGAGSHALTYNDNLFELHFRTGKVGSVAKLKSMRPIPYQIDMTGEVRVDNINYDNCYIYGGPYEMRRKMTGGLPPNRSDFEVKASLPNPELQLAEDLRKYLIANGIQVGGKAGWMKQEKVEKFTMMWIYSGQPLKDVVYWTNKKSVNLFAEQLIMHVCSAKFKDFQYLDLVSRQKQMLTEIGLDSNGIELYDGSGLSRSNKLTANLLTSILRKAKGQKYFETYKASLPQSGRSGSLKSMLIGTDAEGKVFAKSGSFKGVRSYAGYMELPGRSLAFSMILNDDTKSGSEMRKALEELMLILYGS